MADKRPPTLPFVACRCGAEMVLLPVGRRVCVGGLSLLAWGGVVPFPSGRGRGGCEVLLIVVCRRECGGVWLLDGRSTPLGLCVGPHSPFPLPLGGCAKSYILVCKI